jgi:hypothetical protein
MITEQPVVDENWLKKYLMPDIGDYTMERSQFDFIWTDFSKKELNQFLPIFLSKKFCPQVVLVTFGLSLSYGQCHFGTRESSPRPPSPFERLS